MNLDEALAGYDNETLAAWVTQLNCFEWPQDCPVPCPPGWDAPFTTQRALVEIRQILARPLWRYLHQRLTDAEISRAWWVHKLGRTEAEWQAWWDDPAQGAWGKAANAERRRALRDQEEA